MDRYVHVFPNTQQLQVLERSLIQVRPWLSTTDCWCPLTTTAANWPKDARVYLLVDRRGRGRATDGEPTPSCFLGPLPTSCHSRRRFGDIHFFLISIGKGFGLVGLDCIDHLTKSATVGRGRSVGRGLERWRRWTV